jgi:hypothetical protein
MKIACVFECSIAPTVKKGATWNSEAGYPVNFSLEQTTDFVSEVELGGPQPGLRTSRVMIRYNVSITSVGVQYYRT